MLELDNVEDLWSMVSNGQLEDGFPTLVSLVYLLAWFGQWHLLTLPWADVLGVGAKCT